MLSYEIAPWMKPMWLLMLQDFIQEKLHHITITVRA